MTPQQMSKLLNQVQTKTNQNYRRMAREQSHREHHLDKFFQESKRLAREHTLRSLANRKRRQYLHNCYLLAATAREKSKSGNKKPYNSDYAFKRFLTQTGNTNRYDDDDYRKTAKRQLDTINLKIANESYNGDEAGKFALIDKVDTTLASKRCDTSLKSYEHLHPRTHYRLVKAKNGKRHLKADGPIVNEMDQLGRSGYSYRGARDRLLYEANRAYQRNKSSKQDLKRQQRIFDYFDVNPKTYQPHYLSDKATDKDISKYYNEAYKTKDPKAYQRVAFSSLVYQKKWTESPQQSIQTIKTDLESLSNKKNLAHEMGLTTKSKGLFHKEVIDPQQVEACQRALAEFNNNRYREEAVKIEKDHESRRNQKLKAHSKNGKSEKKPSHKHSKYNHKSSYNSNSSSFTHRNFDNQGPER